MMSLHIDPDIVSMLPLRDSCDSTLSLYPLNRMLCQRQCRVQSRVACAATMFDVKLSRQVDAPACEGVVRLLAQAMRLDEASEVLRRLQGVEFDSSLPANLHPTMNPYPHVFLAPQWGPLAGGGRPLVAQPIAAHGVECFGGLLTDQDGFFDGAVSLASPPAAKT